MSLHIVEPVHITDEQFVKAHHPGAEIHAGRHCEVWVEDNGKILGTREESREAAWTSAAAFVTNVKNLIEEMCMVQAMMKSISPATPGHVILTRILHRLEKEFRDYQKI